MSAPKHRIISFFAAFQFQTHVYSLKYSIYIEDVNIYFVALTGLKYKFLERFKAIVIIAKEKDRGKYCSDKN